MRDDKDYSREVILAADKYGKEKGYWVNKLSGEWEKSIFPYDFKETRKTSRHMSVFKFDFSEALNSGLLKLSNASDLNLHMIFTAAVMILVGRYSNDTDIVIGTPIYRQDIEGEFINTVLVLRNSIADNITFKEFLIQVRQTILEAVENQSYPIEMVFEQLNRKGVGPENSLPLEIALLLENIHEKKYLQSLQPNVIFNFTRTGQKITGIVEYNTALYKSATIRQIIRHFRQLLTSALDDINSFLSDIEILTEEEKKELLVNFNNTTIDYPTDKTIHELFENQVERRWSNTALTFIGSLTYRQLDQKANRLARLLKEKGVTAGSVVGIMMEPSQEMVIALMAILKAGGAYLPLDIDLPKERVVYMLEDSNARVLLTNTQSVKSIPFTVLQGLELNRDIHLRVTPSRSHIAEFDQLPLPDRSLINLTNYKDKIGMASVTDCISLQATRGCPYHCLYCHKIWSKIHVCRSADNIYNEIEYYYKNGVTNFAFIDDCFNLKRKESMRLFQLLIKNKLKVQLFFPNGLRGDIMTPDYIDLMVEAGTRGINLSLETGSPRLQKLLKKNLDLEAFKRVVDYIASRHPHVILELATMHGFPGETTEEAMMTLDFIKGIRWLHFPYIHILKIFPNTEMEAFALEQGLSKKDIMKSRDRAFHELPDTLPFPKSFTRNYQADFLNNYFLSRQRLAHVLQHQMKVLSETALVQKYNAYLPVEIKTLDDIIKFTRLEDIEIPGDYRKEKEAVETIFNRPPKVRTIKAGAKKLLFLDLSQHFSSHSMLYRVVEQPLGMIYLLTYLKQQFGDKIDGRIYKAGNDFDSFEQLRVLLEEYKPHLIGIRTLTFFKEFFHETGIFP
jgi:radical SAM superfamily enzyme YgiQ (UPF0313 family)